MATLSQSRCKNLTEATKRNSGVFKLVGHYDPEFVTSTVSELKRLASLQPNWDGYSAPIIDQRIIASAIKFVQSLPDNVAYRPRVVPMSPGNLQFEWHHGKKVLELEFESPTTIRYLQWDPDANVEEEDSFPLKDDEKALDLIQWFMSGTQA